MMSEVVSPLAEPALPVVVTAMRTARNFGTRDGLIRVAVITIVVLL